MGHTSSNDARRWPAWLNAALLLLASWIFVAALSVQIRADTDVVAVVFPPWWSAERALQAAASADAAFVRTTAIPAVLVVRPEERTGLSRLREAGAWLAIDPQAVAACLTFRGRT
jgi:hypothetical protein